MNNTLKQTMGMSAVQKKALFLLCMAGVAFMPMSTVSCKMNVDEDEAPEFDEITLTGANAVYAPYIKLKKTHGLAVSDVVLDKMLIGFAAFLGGPGGQVYADAHPLNITITASDNSSANGRISITFIDSATNSGIRDYFKDYKDAHVYARAKGGLQLAFDQAAQSKKLGNISTLSRALGTRNSVAMFQNGITSLTGQHNAKAM